MAETYINGYFFEYDPEDLPVNQKTTGIQYRVVADLVTEPVTPEFFNAHARIDFDMDDALIEDYIKAARQELEKYSQLSFGAKTMKLMALKLPRDYRLMYGPVTAITAPTATYTLFGDIVKDANGCDVEITYTTGWAEGLPLPIKIAICQRATGLYIHRENILTGLNPATLMDQSEKALDKYKNPYFL